MSRRDLAPLDPQVAAMLASEKILVPCEAAVRARALARAAATAASGPVAPPPPVRRIWQQSTARLSLAAAAFVVLAAVGGAVIQARQHTGHPAQADTSGIIPHGIAPLPVQPPRDVTAPGQTEPTAPEAPSSAAPQPEPSTAKPSLSDMKPAPSAEPLAVGLGLLKRARVAVTRGDFSGALALLSEHEHRFPTGPLTEEREALRIRSLSGLGRVGEAQRAAASFRVRFPHSVFLSHMAEIAQHASE